MNSAQRAAKIQAIIDGFEAEYQETKQRDGILDDSPMVRAAFYGACLKVVRDGPRMESSEVQARLTKYYTEKRDEAYEQVVKRLF